MQVTRLAAAVLVLLGIALAGCALVGGGDDRAASGVEGAAEPGEGDQGQDEAHDLPSGVVAFTIIGDDSEASYHVAETFLQRQELATAVGRTREIEGRLLLDLESGALRPSSVRVDLGSLASDQSRRDQAVRRTLNVAQHPYAVFHLDEVEGLSWTENQVETIVLSGTMEIKGQSGPVTFEVRSLLSGDTLEWLAAAEFNMTDFGIDPPNVLGMISVEEEVRLEVSITARATE